MRTTDLEREMRSACKSLRDGHRELLVERGVDQTDVAMGLVGIALIRVQGDLYDLDPDGGKLAYITPVRVHDVVTPESPVPDSAVRVGDIVDLVAWHPERPDRWALRSGAAEWLGSIPPQYMGPEPVPIRRSPLAWFQSGCTGLVPVSREIADIYRTLNWCIGGIVAEDAEHATELRRALARPWPAPRVLVRDREGQHAA